ncbi:VanZ family protein [Streptomyces sp. NPDC045251]|uniref:VanZ family protein n=1 Tax=unclassified Streptomyces TaxID=2593676 RepID=UPI0033C678CF
MVAATDSVDRFELRVDQRLESLAAQDALQGPEEETAVWRVVLHLTPVTVAAALSLPLPGALVLRSASGRWPRTVCSIGSLALTLWLALIAAATFTASDGSTGGSGGGLWLSPGIETLTADNAYVTAFEKKMTVRQWVAHALMFVPLPILLATARPGLSGAKCLGLCAAAAVVIESVQWHGGNGRIVDLDDVLFNAIGATVGVASSTTAGLLLRWLRDRRADAKERV